MGALALEEPCGCVNALEHAGVGAGPMAALFRATAKALEHARDTDEMGELPSNILAVALQAGVHECSDLPGPGPYFGAMHAQLEEQPAKSSVGECLKGFEGAALTALNIVENMGKALGKPDVEFAFARGFGSFASGMVLAAMGEPCDAPAVTTRGGGGEHEHGEESGDAEGGSTDTRSWLEEAKRKAHEQSHVEPRESLSGAPSKAEPEPLHHTEQAHANVKLWLRALTDVQDKRHSDWLHSAKHDAYELAMALFQHSTAPSSQSKMGRMLEKKQAQRGAGP